MKIIFFVLSLVCILSCKQVTKDFGPFTLNIPSSWTYVPQQGIDSYVGLIAIDQKDTLFFDYGPYSNTLIYTQLDSLFNLDTIPFSFEDFQKLSDFNFNFQYGNLSDSVYLKPYLTQYYTDTTIQSFPAHIVIPRNIGHGCTGIFVDSIWYRNTDSNSGKLVKKLALSGWNLSEKNHKTVMEVIKSLKFKALPLK
ncbi:hypothetical protein SAMN05660841_00384 [Sphingobacterium nematocida]|uniref:Uncharacterized protein n=1 Tax=Sphingobacterium nematocida TaxID=1513896 RepID=A0A1T5B248_9SPHI|nr:hypothetical protein [Sphingobacterium nematocida]SKB41137.1 hypothetical protein SAMN05660841_00384 [Sphingobacterium nematocida]